ncbi:MAG: hypothetical protein BWY27_00520 [Bacteroidetes bacterium ADurb.Bin234]|nr:MAG: hypothetical protein BWY27_00520 [Bacteroidetes bacterium ADurb.Bin234]
MMNFLYTFVKINLKTHMNISALIIMLSVQLSVTVITVYFFYKMLKPSKKNK